MDPKVCQAVAGEKLRQVALQFACYGEYLAAEPYGTGHINDTYAAVFDQAGTQVRYILQRINHRVFKHPPALMENVERVTLHLANKLRGQPDFSRRTLTLVPSRSGGVWTQDASGNYWRAYLFIENARTYDAVESAAQAFEAGRAFGEFQRLLADFPVATLHHTIPDFHHTPKRFAQFERALQADVAQRAVLAEKEITFAQGQRPITDVLVSSGLPERVTHNDTKLNNVMLDTRTGQGVCVIDLDTVMPGLALYDFGDMVRTTTCTSKEDERDLSKVEMQFSLFEALLRGYLAAAGDFLTKPERQYLAFCGKLITFEIGLRFLTDFLDGDIYFKVDRPGHNLDRCRTQFKLVESIAAQEERMQRLVDAL
jgi:hypothetical protein